MTSAADAASTAQTATAGLTGIRAWAAWLRRGVKAAHVEAEAVRFERAGAAATVVALAAIDAVDVRQGWSGARLSVSLAQRQRVAIAGLRADDASRLAEAITHNAALLARRLEVEALAQAEKLDAALAADRFLRHTEAEALRDELRASGPAPAPITGELISRRLPDSARRALQRLRDLGTAEAFERARAEANARYVAQAASRAEASSERLTGFALTAEQAQAVATDEDVTLVLAGAGTGKTTVITGKVAHLVEDLGVRPQEILVLAFNRKAADELRMRLGERLAGVDVSTFHAFGRHIVAQSDQAPSIAKLADDEALLANAIDDVLARLIKDPAQGEALRAFVLYSLGVYRAPYEFETPADYYEYLRQVELRTLNGELVKSLEELKIANFLALNGVPYEYEATYAVETASRAHRQYKPDFHLPAHDLYIEHLGVNRQLEPPPQWSDAEREEYRQGIIWKRELHAENGTRLIETYSWQHREGIWREALRAQLEAEGVEFAPHAVEDILERLQELMSASRLSRLLASFLHQAKGGDLQEAELRERAAASDDAERGAAFLDVFAQVREAYEALLGDELDFHDLITVAAERVREGRWQAPYRYVLVDEFQDISRGRMRLLEALARPGLAYVLVGDDWQSIYRFAGSDVALMRGCEVWLGHVAERTLAQTFRFGRGILEPSSAFVQLNPAQTQRNLRPATRAPDQGITVIWTSDDRRGVALAEDDLDGLGVDAGASVLALGRYNRLREAVRERRRAIEFSAVHSAKGREADYVIVLGLEDDRHGFPSQIEDDPLLDLAAPPEEPFTLAEERRLFYVALTRARHGVYLVADPLKTSRFVRELLDRPGAVARQIGDPQAATARAAPACPRCEGVRMVQSQTARSLRCTNWPHCDQLAPACGCGDGYLLISGDGRAACTNAGCEQPSRKCPACRFGVLVERDGVYGPFWGCSRYLAEPSCPYTRDRRPRS